MTINAKDIESEVMRFVAGETSTRLSTLSLDTRLREDLGVDGQDAADLMKHFAEMFSVDVSSFDIPAHFGSEASFSGLRWVAESLTGTPRNWTPLRIRDLVEAAITKRLTG